MENLKRKAYSFEKLIPIIEATIKDKGVFPLTVTGTSMTPTLYSDRDVVYLVSVNDKPPKKYDIVLFKRTDGTVLLHRIIKILPNNLLLINGDSQNWTEEIEASQIIAITKGYKRNNKNVKCDTLRYRIKSAIWCSTRKLRPFLFKISGFLKGKIWLIVNYSFVVLYDL